MASLPLRPAAQRSQSSLHNQTSEPSSRSIPSPTASTSSSTVLIHPPQHASETEAEEIADSSTSHRVTHADEEELPKCWICFQDPSEDDPLVASPWRHPCPCALTAHEACLLDWIADIEAPTGSRRAGTSTKILCPQCKSEIKLARPSSAVVDTYRKVESLTTLAIIPGLAIAGSASLGLLSQWHGILSIYQIFGPQDAYQLLRPLSDELLRPMSLTDSLSALAHHWRLLVGPTLIPPILILSRTKLADGILPILPMIFFASKPDRLFVGSGKGAWPPSAALSFALLPYVRGAYNAYYERVWSDKEKEWLKQIRPRSGADAQAAEAEEDQGNQRQEQMAGIRIEGGEDLNIEIDFGIVDDWEENERVHREHAARMAHPLNAPPVDADGDDAAPAPDIPDNRRQQERAAAPAQAPQNRERNPVLGAISLTRTIFGALLFPSVAASVGELLRIILPRSWVALPLIRGRWGVTTTQTPAGLLQTRWGRSLVGGCLFVVVRDALRLYVRWKMATMHRKRRVLDYNGPRPGASR